MMRRMSKGHIFKVKHERTKNLILFEKKVLKDIAFTFQKQRVKQCTFQ